MFTVTSSEAAATLSAVKNGSAVVNTANYTFNSGVLTIKKEYLATLANGDKTFTIVLSMGSNLSVTITVAD
ncbi:hypothetical protein PIPA1_38670 [Pelosinus sp. IPA-1]|nr:hypothetical protein PIPA1_38670 [Pelosinus sp. IPA-1]